jgi:hypothetical protein
MFRDQRKPGGCHNLPVQSTEAPASTRYELCEPVSPRLWGLKALGALLLALVLRDDPGYRGGYRYRVRDKHSGHYVYEVTTSPGGLDAQQAQVSIIRDLDQMSVPDFQRTYRINRTDSE